MTECEGDKLNGPEDDFFTAVNQTCSFALILILMTCHYNIIGNYTEDIDIGMMLLFLVLFFSPINEMVNIKAFIH
jgi:hypothetical protein